MVGSESTRLLTCASTTAGWSSMALSTFAHSLNELVESFVVDCMGSDVGKAKPVDARRYMLFSLKFFFALAADARVCCSGRLELRTLLVGQQAELK